MTFKRALATTGTLSAALWAFVSIDLIAYANRHLAVAHLAYCRTKP